MRSGDVLRRGAGRSLHRIWAWVGSSRRGKGKGAELLLDTYLYHFYPAGKSIKSREKQSLVKSNSHSC